LEGGSLFTNNDDDTINPEKMIENKINEQIFINDLNELEKGMEQQLKQSQSETPIEEEKRSRKGKIYFNFELNSIHFY
jgi:hypothetical protein